MPLPPFAAKALRFILIGSGAAALMSAVVNVIAAYKLIEPAEEEMLGLSRNEIVGTYLAIALFGVILIFLGLRKWK